MTFKIFATKDCRHTTESPVSFDEGIIWDNGILAILTIHPPTK